MVGALVMGVLNLALANLSVDSNFIQIIKGMVLLLAVAFDVRFKASGTTVVHRTPRVETRSFRAGRKPFRLSVEGCTLPPVGR
jgi:hypothetical protein